MRLKGFFGVCVSLVSYKLLSHAVLHIQAGNSPVLQREVMQDKTSDFWKQAQCQEKGSNAVKIHNMP